MTPHSPTLPSAFVKIYDLRDEDAWRKAHKDRAFWGPTFTDIAVLGPDHVALTFRPSEDEKWRRWEEVRRAWILGDGAAV